MLIDKEVYFDTNVGAYYEQKLMYESLFFNSPYGVVILDKNKKIVSINKNFTKIFQFSLDDVKGKTITQLICPTECNDQMDNNLELIYTGEIVNQESRRKRKDEQLIDVEILAYPVINNHNIIGVYLIYTDITHKKRLQQRDYLTGLYNRNYFLELVDSYIKNCKEKNEKFVIMYLDLNGFKDINDSLGHNFGDELLIKISKRLVDLNDDKEIISRLNGDEFVILSKFHTKEDINCHAKKILDVLKQPFVIENTTLYITAKIGVSIFPDNGNNVEALIRSSDIAMSKAKVISGDKICLYSREMLREVKDKFLYANHLIKAISNDELSVFYQPIFDIKNQKNIMGLEALLRWESPILGMVSPNIFIPLAEKTGQIISIGEWVLEQVCKQISIWKHRGYPSIPISVNISGKQLEQIGFSESVIHIINKYYVKANMIELEITESVSSGDLSTIIKNLKDLKKNGFKISMDDFGTGFSSLGQLDHFELDKLKIDKIFIDDILHISKRQKLVKTIISMGKSLDLTVVAEGIETKEQLSYLKDLGCHMGQGYLLSKPLPVEKIEKFFK